VKITLIAYNCGGYDTITKQVTVFSPNKPKASFTVDNPNPTTVDVVTFALNAKACVNNVRWKVYKTYNPLYNGTFINGTNKFSFSPQMTFGDTGCYTVELYMDNDNGKDSIKTSCAINVKNIYCIPSVASLIQDIGISNVTLNTINNTSTQSKQDYSNYTPSMSTTLEIGQSYKLSISRTSNANAVTRTAWIDWNENGKLD